MGEIYHWRGHGAAIIHNWYEANNFRAVRSRKGLQITWGASFF